MSKTKTTTTPTTRVEPDPALMLEYAKKVEELTALGPKLGKTIAIILKYGDGELDLATVTLTPKEIALITEALDSHEYWQLSDESERSNGNVILPEDRLDQEDDDEEDCDLDHATLRQELQQKQIAHPWECPDCGGSLEDDDEEEDESHKEIRACRSLAAKLGALLK